MSNENKNVEKTKRYREKRQSTRLSIDIYMDSEREVKIYEWLKTQGGDKQTILAALEKLMESS